MLHNCFFYIFSHQDILYFFVKQCYWSKVPFPDWARTWVNISVAHMRRYRPRRFMFLIRMMEYLDIPFQGRPHSGLDDARNIALVAKRLLEDRAALDINEGVNVRTGAGGGTVYTVAAF